MTPSMLSPTPAGPTSSADSPSRVPAHTHARALLKSKLCDKKLCDKSRYLVLPACNHTRLACPPTRPRLCTPAATAEAAPPPRSAPCVRHAIHLTPFPFQRMCVRDALVLVQASQPVRTPALPAHLCPQGLSTQHAPQVPAVSVCVLRLPLIHPPSVHPPPAVAAGPLRHSSITGVRIVPIPQRVPSRPHGDNPPPVAEVRPPARDAPLSTRPPSILGIALPACAATPSCRSWSPKTRWHPCTCVLLACP